MTRQPIMRLDRTGWSFWTRPERPPRWRACEAAARRRKGWKRCAHWKSQSVVDGMRFDALTVTFVMDTPVDRRIFKVRRRTQLAQRVKPGDVVVRDNLPAH